jgi:hypothetical protein
MERLKDPKKIGASKVTTDLCDRGMHIYMMLCSLTSPSSLSFAHRKNRQARKLPRFGLPTSPFLVSRFPLVVQIKNLNPL